MGRIAECTVCSKKYEIDSEEGMEAMTCSRECTSIMIKSLQKFQLKHMIYKIEEEKRYEKR